MEDVYWQKVAIFLDKSHRETHLELSELRIEDKKIAFLRDCLRDGSRFMQDENGNWHLRFFTHTELEQKIYVRFVNANNPSNLEIELDKYRFSRDFKPLTQLLFVRRRNNSPVDESLVLNASLILKGSATGIRLADLYETEYHCGYLDGRGELFISNHSPVGNFQRHVLLHALAQAYIQAMDLIKERLKPSLVGQGDLQRLRAVYQDFVRFNANYFFMQPVKYSSPVMRTVWQRIDEKYRVCAENHEMFEKIQSVHFLLELENSEKESAYREKAEKKMNLLNISVAGLGVLIAFSTWLISYFSSK